MALCECGCGEITTIAKLTDWRRGYVRGQHCKFIKGHQNRGRFGPSNWRWTNARHRSRSGYIQMTHRGRTRYEHILIAEKAFGGPLPQGAEVHHVNEIKTDNRNQNLVICENNAYHKLLHARMKERAKANGG